MIDRREVYAIGNVIQRRQNDDGLMREWFAGMLAWAEANPGPDAAALRLWLSVAGPKPFYPAFILAGLWPALKIALGMTDKMSAEPRANLLESALITYTKLPTLQNADGTSMFFHGGNSWRARFFIVERLPYWRDKVLSQEQFDDLWFGDAE